MKRSWAWVVLCALGGGSMTAAIARAQTGGSSRAVRGGAAEAAGREAPARDRAEKEGMAEAILAQAEAASGRPFDPAFRARVKSELASRSVEQLAAIRERGTGVRPYAVGDAASDLLFVPVAPCRIIDTRPPGAGGAIAAGTMRNFRVTGSGFTTQGGVAGSCGVPAGPATAMAINLVAVNPAGAGDLRAWPFGSAIPTSSVVNYALPGTGLNLANGFVLKICDPSVSTCTSDFTIQADVSATQVVADVMGYFENFNPDTFRRSTAEFVSIPAAGMTPAQLTSITFTPRFTGDALVTARGYCNMTTNASENQVSLAIGTGATDAFSTSVSAWGVLDLPPNDVGFRQLMFAARRVVPVTRGVAQTLGLFGRHETGDATTDCSGDLVVETLF